MCDVEQDLFFHLHACISITRPGDGELTQVLFNENLIESNRKTTEF